MVAGRPQAFENLQRRHLSEQIRKAACHAARVSWQVKSNQKKRKKKQENLKSERIAFVQRKQERARRVIAPTRKSAQPGTTATLDNLHPSREGQAAPDETFSESVPAVPAWYGIPRGTVAGNLDVTLTVRAVKCGRCPRVSVRRHEQRNSSSDYGITASRAAAPKNPVWGASPRFPAGRDGRLKAAGELVSRRTRCREDMLSGRGQPREL
ncbi:hypothetical protein MRX96_051931 [Rhipicephalus microplus]